MLIRDVMTRNPVSCNPNDTLDNVARKMFDNDCGEIPVCEGTKLVGVVTDRDITCRAVAQGKTPNIVPARDVMTREPITIREFETINMALERMEAAMVRRLPVVDGNGELIGIVSVADVVAKAPTLKVAWAMKSLSKKTRRHAHA